jgi:hypothetical protein
MTKADIGELLIGSVYVAILFSLVRPGAPSSSLIASVSSALIGLVGTVTGYA